MSKNMKLAINGGIAVALLAGLIWFAMGMKDKGATCRYCGKVFPHEHIFGHQSRCPKNNDDRQFDKTGK